MIPVMLCAAAVDPAIAVSHQHTSDQQWQQRKRRNAPPPLQFDVQSQATEPVHSGQRTAQDKTSKFSYKTINKII